MKYSVFQFRLRLEGEHRAALLNSVKEKLKNLKGIEDAEGDLDESSVDLRVHTAFSDADAAKKLHRKVMTTLITIGGVTITQAKTNLTELFG